jgi:hypothetical protein
MWTASVQEASKRDEWWLNTEKERKDTMILSLKTRSEQLQKNPFPTNTSTLTAVDENNMRVQKGNMELFLVKVKSN